MSRGERQRRQLAVTEELGTKKTTPTRSHVAQMDPGIRLIEEVEGTGGRAGRGDAVVFECALTLNRGDVVHRRMRQETLLGSRELIAGVEKALLGMREGGYRKVRISPHLGYRDHGVPDRVPPNAVLVYELWLVAVEEPHG